eukprot:TRINITY_DN10366_c0_g1_i1.p1 TRINITY_DN10366_c0_g1~~TRINITY_DN10366_c0_g1_i1.p1  ORF type:complete len:700 (+),score=148.80 TRINITY_DN10366_c0_g1_i1:52-2151(+)
MDVHGGNPDVLRGAAAAAEAAGLLALGDAEGAVSALKEAARATEDAVDTNGINSEHQSELLGSNKRLLQLAERALREQGPVYCDSTTQTEPTPIPPPALDQVGQFNISNTSFHQQSNDDFAQEATAALRRVEDEKEWLTARVKELENKLTASEALDTWALESKLSGTASTQESQAVAMLQSELDTLKSEMESHIESERQKASDERKGMEEEILTLRTELSTLEKKSREVPQIDLRNLTVDPKGSRETVSLPSRSLPSSPLTSPRKRQGILKAFSRKKNNRSPPPPPLPPVSSTVALEDDDFLLELGSPALPPSSPIVSDLPSDLSTLFDQFPAAINSNFSSVSTVSSGKVLQSQSLPASFDRCSALLLSNHFCAEYHNAHGEFTKKEGSSGKGSCSYSPWVHHPGYSEHAGYRTLQCLTVVQAPWSQQTAFVEKQRYYKGSGVLALQITSLTPAVMCGDCFRCEVLVMIEGNSTSSSITITASVHFMKSPFMGLKSKISSTAMSELADSFQLFLNRLISALSSSPSSPSSPTRSLKQAENVINEDSVEDPEAVVFDFVEKEKDGVESGVIVLSGITYLAASCTLSGLCHKIAVVTTEASSNFQVSAAAAKCLAQSVGSADSLIPLPNIDCDVATASVQLSSILEAGPEVFRALQPLQTQLYFVLSSLHEVAFVACLLLSSTVIYLLLQVLKGPPAGAKS